MNKAFLLTGGNLGNRTESLQKAALMIAERCGKILKASSIYETEAWGLKTQPDFYNQALLIETKLPPEKLLHELLQIEKEIGRKRTIKMGPRIIDIDILLYGDEIINEKEIQIPHPLLHERRFTLTPLAEIAGNIIHPVFSKSIQQLLHECTDNSNVNKIAAMHSALPLYLSGK